MTDETLRSVLREASKRLFCCADAGNDSVASVLAYACDAMAEALETAQGNGEEGRVSVEHVATLNTSAAAADQRAPSPAPSDSTHWEGCGVQGGHRHYECLLGEYDALRAKVARLQSVQGACRERIYNLLADDDLSDETLREFAEAALPQIHDALHQSSGYSPSECFTDGPAERYLREIAESERDDLRAKLAAAEEMVNDLREALIWTSGSIDFASGGVAREGWLRVCQPLLDEEVTR